MTEYLNGSHDPCHIHSPNVERIRIAADGLSYFKEVYFCHHCKKSDCNFGECLSKDILCDLNNKEGCMAKRYREVETSYEGLQPGTKVYAISILTIVISPPYGSQGWHMSISTTFRDPTWKEIRDAWYDLVPEAANRNAGILLPPKSEYVNLHNFCFHVHELPLDAKMKF